MTLYLKYATRSDRGLIRGNNQDSAYAGPRLLAVADGMGGHVAGEVASKIVIAAMEPLDEDVPGDDLLEILQDAVHNGSAHMKEVIESRPELDGMGTTLTAILFAGNRIGVCHVGDSRAYMLRDGDLSQITKDHSFVQALVDEGRITQEEASVHPQRSVILRALNGSEVEPDVRIREARSGDRYLICSDGLTDAISTETMREALGHGDPEEASELLVDLALRAGGPDNITVVIADVLNDEETEDFSDGKPVVDGAAGGNVGQREVDSTTAASRAAILTNSAASKSSAGLGEDEPDAPPAKKGRRRWFTLGLILVVLVGLFFAGRTYVNSQYFVGVSGSEVVIFNGVNSKVGPVELYSVAERTDVMIADLTEVAQNSAENGLAANSLADARMIVVRLKKQLLPLCDSVTSSGSASPRGGALSSGASSSPASSASTPPSGTSNSAAATSTSSPPATTTPTPGVNCREG